MQSFLLLVNHNIKRNSQKINLDMRSYILLSANYTHLSVLKQKSHRIFDGFRISNCIFKGLDAS